MAMTEKTTKTVDSKEISAAFLTELSKSWIECHLNYQLQNSILN